MMLSIAVFISMVLAVAESQEPTRNCTTGEYCRYRIDNLSNTDEILHRDEAYNCLCETGQCPNDPYDWEHTSNNVIHRSLGRYGNDSRRVEIFMFCNRVRPWSSVCQHNRSVIVNSLTVSSGLFTYNCRCPDGKPHELVSEVQIGDSPTIKTYTCWEFVPWCQRNQKCKEDISGNTYYYCKCSFDFGFRCKFEHQSWNPDVTPRNPGYCHPIPFVDYYHYNNL